MDPRAATPEISDWANSFSVQEILKGNFQGLEALFILIISIAVYSIIIYNFYRYIARRDCFKPSKRKHTKLIGFTKYFFLFPIIASMFFMGFSLMLIFLTKIDAAKIISTSFALIVAIRITSYYTEDLSKDVAKMLPFALLGVFLVDPSYFTMNDVYHKISTLPENANTIVQFILLIILVEWILRTTLFAKNKILPKKETEKIDINQK